MNLNENILRMPVWKAFVCILLIITGTSFLMEEILSHTVFHIFDKFIMKMEKDKYEDRNDLDEIDAFEQHRNCQTYQELLLKEKFLAEKSAPDAWDKNDVEEKRNEVKWAVKSEHFSIAKCEKEIGHKK